jgi:hypothetical protein
MTGLEQVALMGVGAARGGDGETGPLIRVAVGTIGDVLMNRDLGELIALGSAATELRPIALRGIDREPDRAEGQRAGEPSVLASPRDPLGTRVLALVLVRPVCEEAGLTLLVAAHPARDHRAWNVSPVNLAAPSAAPLLKGRVLIPIRRAARRTRLRGVTHPTTRIVSRPRSPDRPPRPIPAAHDGLMTAIRSGSTPPQSRPRHRRRALHASALESASPTTRKAPPARLLAPEALGSSASSRAFMELSLRPLARQPGQAILSLRPQRQTRVDFDSPERAAWAAPAVTSPPGLRSSETTVDAW